MKKKEVEQFIERVRGIYNDWDLKLMVLLSLALQVTLMFLGGRRKFTPKIWVRAIVWSAYISADSIAVIALGILSSQLGQINNQSGTIDEKTRLVALWAPCLLLLLGGPDNITAYALEDNELWLRHLLGLVVQTTATGYIYFLAWSTSYLSLLSILMFVAGLIKYGERVWVLWQASSDKLKDSMLAPPDPSPNYPRFMDQYTLKQAEGYHVTADEIFEIQEPLSDLSAPPVNKMLGDAEELVKAYRFFQIFKRLFVDLILSSDDRDAVMNIFKNLKWESAFKIIEIELGFMYDLLYTKALVLYSKWGPYRRLTTSGISCIILALFTLAEKPHYPKVDLALTYLLLVVIIFIEIFSMLMLVTSDWAGVWLSNTEPSKLWCVASPKKVLGCVVSCLQLFRQPRWLNCVGQVSFFSFSIKAKPLPCQRILKLLFLHKKLDKLYYTQHKEITKYIKEQIFIGIPNRAYRDFEKHNDLLRYVLYSEGNIYGQRDSKVLAQATQFEFDQSILVWHIATELCYYSYKHDDKPHLPNEMMEPRKAAKILSRYMYYLLVRYPFILPSGIGQIRLRDTLAEALKFFKERGLFTREKENQNFFSCCANRLLDPFKSKEQRKIKRQKLRRLAHKMLLEVNTEVPPNRVKGGQSKSVLFDGCALAKELIHHDNYSNKWLLFVRSWLVLLYSAAYQCKGDAHARQLRRGGELMTHVWLMMTHFGVTNDFKMTQGHAIAKLILN